MGHSNIRVNGKSQQHFGKKRRDPRTPPSSHLLQKKVGKDKPEGEDSAPKHESKQLSNKQSGLEAAEKERKEETSRRADTTKATAKATDQHRACGHRGESPESMRFPKQAQKQQGNSKQLGMEAQEMLTD